MSILKKLKDYIYRTYPAKIDQKYEYGTWRNEFARYRLWFICSDFYETRMKSRFTNLLKNYPGKIYSRGILAQLDYWLCWIFLGAEPEDYFEYDFFKKDWKWRSQHITKQRLMFMDTVLNDKNVVDVVSDKGKFYEHWNDFLARKWCIPQQLSYEEFLEKFRDVPRIIVKPRGLYGGLGIYALDLNADNIHDVYLKLHNEKDEIIAEEYIFQKGILNDINPSSLNHIRVCTFRNGDYVCFCFSFFAAGRKGSIVSNDGDSGGINYPVNVETGEVGLDHDLTSINYPIHPDSGIQVTGMFLPDWEKIKQFALRAHMNAPEGIHIVGWDICWSNGQLCMIEGNNSPGFASPLSRNENQWAMMQKCMDQIRL